MQNVFVIGAGLSATDLIGYLLKHSSTYDWQITVGDLSLEMAQRKVAGHSRGCAIPFDINNQKSASDEIERCDVVVSMLPAMLNPLVASECLKHGKHLLTPSYVSPEMKHFDADAREKGLTFLNELGVDPGIDHMSAMRVIDQIKKNRGRMLSFKSFCGGLVAPDCDDNPWNYKFSWNPRNVVLAGQGTAKYLDHGQYKYVPYGHLYTTLSHVEIPGYGNFEVYPNRDSLQYRELYDLIDIPSIVRGTMRRPGYCEGWNVFVQLGCTDDSYIMEDSHLLSYRQYLDSFLPYQKGKRVEEKLAERFCLPVHGDVMQKIGWLGLFSDNPIGLKDATPAMVMQHILEQKWSMETQDRDLLVMQHQFDFELKGQQKRIISSMSYEGCDQINTAMSYTVGTPLAIATKLLLTDSISPKGVVIPTFPEIYNPVLEELEELGIVFTEQEFDL